MSAHSHVWLGAVALDRVAPECLKSSTKQAKVGPGRCFVEPSAGLVWTEFCSGAASSASTAAVCGHGLGHLWRRRGRCPVLGIRLLYDPAEGAPSRVGHCYLAGRRFFPKALSPLAENWGSELQTLPRPQKAGQGLPSPFWTRQAHWR